MRSLSIEIDTVFKFCFLFVCHFLKSLNSFSKTEIISTYRLYPTLLWINAYNNLCVCDFLNLIALNSYYQHQGQVRYSDNFYALFISLMGLYLKIAWMPIYLHYSCLTTHMFVNLVLLIYYCKYRHWPAFCLYFILNHISRNNDPVLMYSLSFAGNRTSIKFIGQQLLLNAHCCLFVYIIQQPIYHRFVNNKLISSYLIHPTYMYVLSPDI